MIAVYTPKQNLTSCEILTGGSYIILALEGQEDLTTLKLKGPNIEESETEEIYGDQENTGKEFELKDNDSCWHI